MGQIVNDRNLPRILRTYDRVSFFVARITGAGGSLLRALVLLRADNAAGTASR